jgi:hypothetical protein
MNVAQEATEDTKATQAIEANQGTQDTKDQQDLPARQDLQDQLVRQDLQDQLDQLGPQGPRDQQDPQDQQEQAALNLRRVSFLPTVKPPLRWQTTALRPLPITLVFHQEDHLATRLASLPSLTQASTSLPMGYA